MTFYFIIKNHSLIHKLDDVDIMNLCSLYITRVFHCSKKKRIIHQTIFFFFGMCSLYFNYEEFVILVSKQILQWNVYLNFVDAKSLLYVIFKSVMFFCQMFVTWLYIKEIWCIFNLYNRIHKIFLISILAFRIFCLSTWSMITVCDFLDAFLL